MKSLHDYLNHERPQALYIAGFGSGPTTSTTYKRIRKYLGKKWDVICPNLDLTESPMSTHEGISRLAQDYDLVIGSSLGAFYVMGIDTDCHRIVINPCMVPSKELPEIATTISDEALKEFKRLEKKLKDIDDEDRGNVYGIFGKDDELFSYIDMFKEKYNKYIVVPGGHKLPQDSLLKGLGSALRYFDKNSKKIGE